MRPRVNPLLFCLPVNAQDPGRTENQRAKHLRTLARSSHSTQLHAAGEGTSRHVQRHTQAPRRESPEPCSPNSGHMYDMKSGVAAQAWKQCHDTRFPVCPSVLGTRLPVAWVMCWAMNTG